MTQCSPHLLLIDLLVYVYVGLYYCSCCAIANVSENLPNSNTFCRSGVFVEVAEKRPVWVPLKLPLVRERRTNAVSLPGVHLFLIRYTVAGECLAAWVLIRFLKLYIM